VGRRGGGATLHLPVDVRAGTAFATLRADMGVLLTLIAGLALWIVLWAIGVKSFDAFMITIVMMIVAAAAHIIWPTLPGNRDPERPS